MVWKLSRFKAGDRVEVRSRDEILATLDANGCYDGMPFMPEMLAYCEKPFQVAAVAHKSCDTVKKTWAGRRMDETVHLAGMRCDGSAHGGCQADCTIFWKDAWLKPAPKSTDATRAELLPIVTPSVAGCTLEQLQASTCVPGAGGESPCYSCQATRHFEATQPLAWWDVRQYLRDITTRNHSATHVGRILWLSFLKNWLKNPPIGYRLFRGLRARLHRWTTGREVPDIKGQIPRGSATPTARLNLKPGEYVRIKSKAEIEKTINEDGNNRGLSFDEEMTRYCGRVFQVRSVVTQIIDEPTGKMIQMKQPCITLQGVVCAAEFSACRLMCPREIPSYWRELWMDRVETAVATEADSETHAVAAGANGTP